MASNSQLPYETITHEIIGCSMKVHSFYGLGFPEVIYKRSLLVELENRNLRYRSEMEKDICYSGKFVGRRRLDLIVNEKILVEIKAIKELENSHYKQVLNYLNVFDLEVGLLINFGAESLQFKRLIRSKQSAKSSLNP